MNPVEERLRESLRDRARDVEATPWLWQEVDRRTLARRRRVAWSASLASAALAALAIVVAPMLVGPDRQPEITPADRDREAIGESLATGATVPGHLVLADGESLVLVDVRAGTEHGLPAPDGELLDVAVRPGTSPGADLEVAYAAQGTGDEVTIGVIDEDGDGVLVERVASPGAVRPSVAWSPDGQWLAWSRSDGESHVGLARIDERGADPVGAVREYVPPREASRDGPMAEGLVLTDWVDEGLGGLHLLGTHLDGQAVSLPTHLPDEEPSIEGAAPTPQGMIVRAHAAADRLSPEGGYALADHGDGLELRFTTPDDSVGLPVPEDLGEAPYVLDAVGDAVSVADGEHAWLVTHDGDGGDPQVVELGSVTAVSMVRS